MSVGWDSTWIRGEKGKREEKMDGWMTEMEKDIRGYLDWESTR